MPHLLTHLRAHRVSVPTITRSVHRGDGETPSRRMPGNETSDVTRDERTKPRAVDAVDPQQREGLSDSQAGSAERPSGAWRRACNLTRRRRIREANERKKRR